MQEAVTAALELCSAASVPWLVLSGPVGCGKTHLAYAVANRMAAQGWKVRLWVVADLLDEIRGLFRQAETKKELVPQQAIAEMTYDPDVLILDDLGAEKNTDWALEELFQIIDRRYREGKALMVTTNQKLLVFPERVRSRLCDQQISRLVLCDSPDYRRGIAPRSKQAGKRG